MNRFCQDIITSAATTAEQVEEHAHPLRNAELPNVSPDQPGGELTVLVVNTSEKAAPATREARGAREEDGVTVEGDRAC